MTAPKNAPCLCARLRRASRLVTRHYDEALEPSGLTTMQFSAMRWIGRLDGPGVSALAEATGHERTAMWRSLQPLIAKGLVTLTDGVLRVTAKGKRSLMAATPLWDAAQETYAQGMGARLAPLLAALEEVERHAV